MNKRVCKSLMALVFLALIGCSSRPAPTKVIYESRTIQPGEAQYVWEEPVVDAIDVPPGLDPDGIYYRPAHKEVVEIRQGRWKYYEGDKNCTTGIDCAE